MEAMRGRFTLAMEEGLGETTTCDHFLHHGKGTLTPKHLRRTFWLFADLGRLL
jgi:hypothetical protein